MSTLTLNGPLLSFVVAYPALYGLFAGETLSLREGLIPRVYMFIVSCGPKRVPCKFHL